MILCTEVIFSLFAAKTVLTNFFPNPKTNFIKEYVFRKELDVFSSKFSWNRETFKRITFYEKEGTEIFKEN